MTFVHSVVGGEGIAKSLSCGSTANKNETDLKRRFGQYIANENLLGAYYIHPLLTNNIDIRELQKHSYESTRLLYGNRRCRSVLRKKKYGIQLMDRSVCPWYIVLTVNHDRFPVYMATARCTCKKCYDADGNQPRVVRKNPPICVPIKIKVRVLRQQFAPGGSRKLCDKNVFLYEESYEEVTVGCTCKVVDPEPKPGLPVSKD